MLYACCAVPYPAYSLTQYVPSACILLTHACLILLDAEFLELQGEAADSILEPKNGVLASCASALA